MSPSLHPTIHQISKCTVKPLPLPSPGGDTLKIIHLTPWDLARLSTRYIQKGLLFSDLPSSFCAEKIVHHLRYSLSGALHHFYPLAGRFQIDPVLDNNQEVTGMTVSLSCSCDGAEFIHAAAKTITVADVLAPSLDVPSFFQSFFPLDGAVNFDGHLLPLLAVQLTELHDGIFLGCCFNHAAGDGNSYWNFFNAWAEIARMGAKDGVFAISRPPVLDRWFVDGVSGPIKLPFCQEKDFVERYSPPLLRENIFHFSSCSVARLKAKANEECDSNAISSFQALCSLVWRAITRVRRLPTDQKTTCSMSIQNRTRLQQPLSSNYFGNSIDMISTTVTAGKLLAHGLGWAALQLNQIVRGHTSDVIREKVKKYCDNPAVSQYGKFDKCGVLISSSPRFEMYGCDFGWGKAVAVRSGAANKLDGKVMAYPGRDGGGSVELEVCLSPETMSALELDEEFMAAVSQ